MSLKKDIQSLTPGAIVEMFILDLTPIKADAGMLFFHGGTNEVESKIVWQGNTYEAYPVQASGFSYSGNGQPPRPKISVATADGVVGALNVLYDDMIGAKVIRKRTFAKYLDAINFPGGENPTADPVAEFPVDIFYINRKESENARGVSYELVSSVDLENFKLPSRLVLSNLCPWTYRKWSGTSFDYSSVSECTYTAESMYDFFDQPTVDPAKDVCGKRLESCRIRFASDVGIPFGGFPGAGRIS